MSYPSYPEDYEETHAGHLDEMLEECGKAVDGYCVLSGTEHCDFECPFRNEPPGET